MADIGKYFIHTSTGELAASSSQGKLDITKVSELMVNGRVDPQDIDDVAYSTLLTNLGAGTGMHENNKVQLVRYIDDDYLRPIIQAVETIDKWALKLNVLDYGLNIWVLLRITESWIIGYGLHHGANFMKWIYRKYT